MYVCMYDESMYICMYACMRVCLYVCFVVFKTYYIADTTDDYTDAEAQVVQAAVGFQIFTGRLLTLLAGCLYFYNSLF